MRRYDQMKTACPPELDIEPIAEAEKFLEFCDGFEYSELIDHGGPVSILWAIFVINYLLEYIDYVTFHHDNTGLD